MYGQYGFEFKMISNAIAEMKGIEAELSEMSEKAAVSTKEMQTSFTEMGESIKGTFESIKVTAESLFGMFAIFEGYEFISKSGEAFEALHKANVQLQAGLESTRGVSGETLQSLESDQDKFRKNVDISKASIADMQAQILTFPKISSQVFPQVEQDVMDMATRLHHGLDETSIMVSKALQDPLHLVRQLRRVGVDFTEQELEKIQTLAKTNHLLEAQKLILNEIQTEFGGSAEAAASANPFFELDKATEDLRLDLGSLIDEIKVGLAPALISFTEGVKNVVDWIRRNKDMLIELWNVLKPILELWLAYKVAMGLAALETWAAVAAQWALNAAMDANPIGIMITAIGGLALAYNSLTGSIQSAEDAKNAFDNVGYQDMKDSIDKLKDSYTDKKGKLNEGDFVATLNLKISTKKKELDEANAKYNAAIQPTNQVNGTIGLIDNPFDYAKRLFGSKVKDSDEATKEGTIIGVLKSQLKALNDGLKENKAGYTPPGGSGVTSNAGNSTDISGARGGLSDAKKIYITFRDMVHIDKASADNVKKMAETAGEQLMRQVNNLSLSQSATF